MSPFTRRTSRPFSIARRSLLPLAAGLALACNILPAAAGEADYPVGGTIAVGARVCETIPVDPFWECANAGGTGAIYLVSYAGDVVLTVDESIIHGGTSVWGEAAGVPMTGYTLHLENAQAPAGYSLYDIYVEPGTDGGPGVNGPYVNLTEQQPSAALYLIYIPDGQNPYGDTDTDGDGMVDGAENYQGTDPYDPDTDGDGIVDGEEWTTGTDPLDPASPGLPENGAADADHDGLTNYEEFKVYGTDWYWPDTDFDGVIDGDEVFAGTDPLDANDFPAGQTGLHSDGDGLSDNQELNVFGTDPNNPDTDDDGLTDYDELFTYGISDPLTADADGDGLTDAGEIEAGTDPYLYDTDGDGANDGSEVIYAGTDPLDAASFYAVQAGPEPDGDDGGSADDAPAASAPAASAPAATNNQGGNARVTVTSLPNTGAGEVEADTDELAAYAAAAIGAIGLAAAGIAWRRRTA